MSEALSIMSAYLGKRWILASLKTPKAVFARQRRLVESHMRRIATTIPFYRQYAGLPLHNWPVMDKASSLAHFTALNAHGVTREAAWEAAEQALKARNGSGRIGDLTVGTSSGTSGNRGLFLVSSAERRLWLGSMLARTLPDFPLKPHRVAVMLSTANELYDTTIGSRRLAFQFYDVRKGVAAHLSAMEQFAPDVVVAPPKALRALAEAGARIEPARLFAGGEVLDPLDADLVQNSYGVRPRSIYQATEGFLGVECAHGRIHLNEDDILFERQPVAGHPQAFTPIITDLRRTSQAMIRYRLNDILVPAAGRCRCGSPLAGLARVEGRCDDVIKLPTTAGGTVKIMPDAIRTAILDADRSIDDFRVKQVDRSSVLLAIRSPDTVAATQRALAALRKLLENHAVLAVVSVGGDCEIDFSQKLRRIRQDYDGPS